MHNTNTKDLKTKFPVLSINTLLFWRCRTALHFLGKHSQKGPHFRVCNAKMNVWAVGSLTTHAWLAERDERMIRCSKVCPCSTTFTIMFSWNNYLLSKQKWSKNMLIFAFIILFPPAPHSRTSYRKIRLVSQCLQVFKLILKSIVLGFLCGFPK